MAPRTREEILEAIAQAQDKGRSTLRPLSDIDKEVGHYEPKRYMGPRLSGFSLRSYVTAMELGLSTLIVPLLKRQNGFRKILVQIDVFDPPMLTPRYDNLVESVEPATLPVDASASPIARVEAVLACLPKFEPLTEAAIQNSFRYWRVRDYAYFYGARLVTPSQVADRIIGANEDSKKANASMHFFIALNSKDIRREAKKATQRYAAGKPLSILDGVPFAVKDEVDCLPYQTTAGTSFMGYQRKVEETAVCVARLKACGAVMVGKTNMHELGNGVLGINTHYGTTRNPHNPAHFCGGSSSGSAAVVSAGICPIALGADAGGSIRIPASLCGVFGMKATMGRIPSKGSVPLTWTLGSLGPITGCVEDALIAYAAMLGPAPGEPTASTPLPPQLPLLQESVVGQLKLGIFEEWFVDCDKTVREVCGTALRQLTKTHGTKVFDINIPELHEMACAHVTTLGSEMAQGVNWDYEFGKRGQLQWDCRLLHLLYRSFTARDYLTAQRIRTRAMHHHFHVFEAVDIIVTPTTARTAPPIYSHALTSGQIDLPVIGDLMRYMSAGNFLGLPAVTVPVGYDENGLPIGLQLIGRPWQEASLLHVAAALEAALLPSMKRPAVFYNVLKGKMDQRKDVKKAGSRFDLVENLVAIHNSLPRIELEL